MRPKFLLISDTRVLGIWYNPRFGTVSIAGPDAMREFGSEVEKLLRQRMDSPTPVESVHSSRKWRRSFKLSRQGLIKFIEFLRDTPEIGTKAVGPVKRFGRLCN